MQSTCFSSDLFWLCLSPAVLPFFTYENLVLGSVDQRVKWYKGHDARETETACLDLHANLGAKITKTKQTIKPYFLERATCLM